MLRIAILWSELSGYLNACMQSLVKEHEVRLCVYRITRNVSVDRPYNDSLFTWISDLNTLPNNSANLAPAVINHLENFQPDAILIVGWSHPVYRRVARHFKSGIRPIIAGCDNQWHGTWKQWGGTLISRWWLHPMYDALWTPGERGVTFARRLGYRGLGVMEGLYACNTYAFEPVSNRETCDANQWPKWPPRFLFTGRLAKEKGIEDLIRAYQLYRAQTQQPWELWCAGSGPLEYLLKDVPGVRLLGFVQPNDLPEIFRQVSVLILPSHFEPWGVVVHEATCAGLSVLCTRQCGSSVELVQDGYNGYLFDAGDYEHLANLMLYYSQGRVDFDKFGANSVALSSRYSPSQWADYLVQRIVDLARTKSLQ
ncbi:MAG TPA: glycosyltransferase [Anaerolineae bacterium]|nr:glycosyltransferase [Anaerolineae bacterium]HMR65283.1 glycosyltransferase [Anaerolineae bacterium]